MHLGTFTVPFHNPLFNFYISYSSPVSRDLHVVLLVIMGSYCTTYCTVRGTCITQFTLLHMLVAVDILSLSQRCMQNVILLEGNCGLENNADSYHQS